MLAAGIAPYFLVFPVAFECNVWDWLLSEEWRMLLAGTVTATSIERFHATLCPFLHRVIKTSIYRLVIAFAWVTAVPISVAATVCFFEI